jgi:MSHA biogenesis protein MshI
MPFRRPHNTNSPWVGIAQDGAVLLAVEVSHAAERPAVQWVGRVDASGFSQGLQTLNRQRRLHGAKLVGLLPPDAARLVAIPAPDVPRSEWVDALRWSLRDHVDFEVDDALIDVLEVPEATQLRQSRPTLTVVLPRDRFVQLQTDVDDAGLHWSALDTAETALRNISALGEEEGKAHALLAFGETHSLLVITYQGELVMARQIEVQGAAMTSSNDAREGALSRASLEVLRTIDTFERVHSEVSLQGLSVVLPPGTGDEVLPLLSDLIYVPVQPFQIGNWVDLTPLGADHPWVRAGVNLADLCALGAALRPLADAHGRQQLRFVDETADGGAGGPWSAQLGLRLAGLVAGLGLAVGVGVSLWASHAGNRAQQVEAELAQLQRSASEPQASGVTRELEELQRKEAVQTQLREVLQGNMSATSMGYSDLLISLGRQTQPGLWITGLKVRGDGRDLELSGRMVNPALLPAYLRRLEREDRFRSRRFAQIEMKDVVGEEGAATSGVTEFTLRGREAAERQASTKESP